MTSRDDALARAREWLGDPAAEIGVHEFDLGYVLWRVEPPTADHDPGHGTRLPPVPTRFGAARAVIDKETGELTTWGSAPVQVIAADYTARKAAAERFPPDVLEALRLAGWRPGRSHRAAVDAWLRANMEDLAGLELSDAARAALDEFGGLYVRQAGPGGAPNGGFPTQLDPSHIPVRIGGVRAFIHRIGINVFPIGYHEDGPSHVVIDPAGRVFLLHWIDDFVVADSMDEAVLWLVRGKDEGPLPAIADDGTW